MWQRLLWDHLAGLCETQEWLIQTAKWVDVVVVGLFSRVQGGMRVRSPLREQGIHALDQRGIILMPVAIPYPQVSLQLVESGLRSWMAVAGQAVGSWLAVKWSQGRSRHN